MKRKPTAAFITLSFLSLIGVSKPQATHAEEVSFGMYPAVTKLYGMPGENVEATIYLRNNQNTSLTLTPLLQPFKASPFEDGTVQYEQSVTGFYRTISIKDNGNIVTEINLAPNEEKAVTLVIPVPRQATSEDYYFSFILLTSPASHDLTAQDKTVTATTSVSGGVGSHILLSISPKNVKEIKLAEFSSASFSQSSPVSFLTRVTNENDNFARVHGKIIIKNVFGSTVEEVTIPETAILSHSTRALNAQARGEKNNEIQKHQSMNEINQTHPKPEILQNSILLPGIYRAEIVLETVPKTSPITSTHYFAVAPVHLIVGVIVFLILLYLVKRRILLKLQK